MNTYIPHITMHLSSIANAVNIINTLDGKNYPVPRSLDHRTIGNLFTAINADYPTVPGQVGAYQSAINNAFGVLDALYVGSAPTASAPVFSGTIPGQTGSIAAPISWDLSSYFTGDDIVFSATGTALPNDLSLDTDTGIISSASGIAAGTTDHTITATNNSGADVSNTFTIDIT